MNASYDYGFWFVAVVNAVIFIVFAFSFTRPKTARDWRSFGAFSAFVVALFAEMYGFPLTIYLLSGWLSSRYPGLDLFAHESGHLWQTLLGLDSADPAVAHMNPLHVLSNILIVLGGILVITAWKELHSAQREGRLATGGPYARIRHPQYVGFVAVLFGFLLQWPTILTLAMFPVLVFMYTRLARIEEREVRSRFGKAYDDYALGLPRFIPRRGVRFESPTFPAQPAFLKEPYPPERLLPPHSVTLLVPEQVTAGRVEPRKDGLDVDSSTTTRNGFRVPVESSIASNAAEPVSSEPV